MTLITLPWLQCVKLGLHSVKGALNLLPWLHAFTTSSILLEDPHSLCGSAATRRIAISYSSPTEQTYCQCIFVDNTELANAE